MRTTLDIDDDVLAAAKELARREKLSAGQLVSRLLRSALTGQGTAAVRTVGKASATGFRPFESRGRVVTNKDVDTLRDAEGA